MGSFHQTCAVSHMPIMSGDPVVGFVLCKAYGYHADSATGYVGSGSVWQAVSLPFRGKYDDYGFVHGVDLRFAAATLLAVTGKSFDDLTKAAKSGGPLEAKIPHPYGDTALMTMFVHAGLWEKLSAATVTPYGREIDFEAESKRIGELLEALDVRAQAEHERFPVLPKRLLGGTREADQEWTEATGRNWTECPYAADFFVSRKTEGVHPGLRHAICDLVSQAWAEGDREIVHAVVADCLRTTIFDENMGKLRRLWTPQCGLGSQDVDLALHAEMAAWTADRCSEIEAKYDYDGEGDEPGPSAPSLG